MKTLTLAPILAFAGLSLAQLQGLPTCAQSCANVFLNNGIGNCNRDIACICADKDFISAISCCLIQQCNADDQQKAIDFAQQLCSVNQVSVPNSVICTSTATSSSTTSSGAAAGQTTTGSSTPANNSGATTTTSSASSGGASSTSGSSSGTSAGATGASSSSKPTSASGNFGPRQTAAPVLGALGGIVAVAALL